MVYPNPCFLLGATIDKTLFYVSQHLDSWQDSPTKVDFWLAKVVLADKSLRISGLFQ